MTIPAEYLTKGTHVIIFWFNQESAPWGSARIRPVSLTDLKSTVDGGQPREGIEALVQYNGELHPILVQEIQEDTSLCELLLELYGDNKVSRKEKRGFRHAESLGLINRQIGSENETVTAFSPHTTRHTAKSTSDDTVIADNNTATPTARRRASAAADNAVSSPTRRTSTPSDDASVIVLLQRNGLTGASISADHSTPVRTNTYSPQSPAYLMEDNQVKLEHMDTADSSSQAVLPLPPFLPTNPQQTDVPEDVVTCLGNFDAALEAVKQSAEALSGHVRPVQYDNTRLTDECQTLHDQLQQLTAEKTMEINALKQQIAEFENGIQLEGPVSPKMKELLTAKCNAVLGEKKRQMAAIHRSAMEQKDKECRAAVEAARISEHSAKAEIVSLQARMAVLEKERNPIAPAATETAEYLAAMDAVKKAEAEVAEVKGKLTDLEKAKRSALEKKGRECREAKKREESARANLASLRDRLSAAERQADQSKKSEESLQAELTAWKDRLSAATKQHENSKKTALEKKESDCRAEVAAAKKAEETARTDLETLKGRLDAREKQAEESKKAALDKKDSEHRVAQETAKKSEEATKSDLATANRAVLELKHAVETAEKSEASAKADLVAEKAKVSELEKQVGNLNKELLTAKQVALTVQKAATAAKPTPQLPPNAALVARTDAVSPAHSPTSLPPASVASRSTASAVSGSNGQARSRGNGGQVDRTLGNSGGYKGVQRDRSTSRSSHNSGPPPKRRSVEYRSRDDVSSGQNNHFDNNSYQVPYEQNFYQNDGYRNGDQRPGNYQQYDGYSGGHHY